MQRICLRRSFYLCGPDVEQLIWRTFEDSAQSLHRLEVYRGSLVVHQPAQCFMINISHRKNTVEFYIGGYAIYRLNRDGYSYSYLIFFCPGAI